MKCKQMTFLIIFFSVILITADCIVAAISAGASFSESQIFLQNRTSFVRSVNFVISLRNSDFESDSGQKILLFVREVCLFVCLFVCA